MRRKGFTLVEMLVVIVLLTILAGLIYAVAGSVKARARRMTCMATLRDLGLTVSMYRDETGVIPGGTDVEWWIANEYVAPCSINPDAAAENWNPQITGRRSLVVGEIHASTGAFAVEPESARVAIPEGDVICTFCQHDKWFLVLYLDGHVTQERNDPAEGIGWWLEEEGESPG